MTQPIAIQHSDIDDITLRGIAYTMLILRKASERVARRYRDVAANAWLKFVHVALRIQQSNLWCVVAETWQDYCKSILGISASRIRQYKGAAEYVEAINDAGYACEASERDLRRLRQVVKSDDPLMPVTYETGQTVAQILGLAAPTAAVYRHAYETLQEADSTGAVDIDGAQVAASIPDAVEGAVLSNIAEAKRRNVATMQGKQRVSGTLRRLGHGWQFVPDETIDLPDEVRVTFYIEVAKN